jgi:hypothetical protein
MSLTELDVLWEPSASEFERELLFSLLKDALSFWESTESSPQSAVVHWKTARRRSARFASRFLPHSS